MAQQNTLGKKATTISTHEGWTIITYHQTQVVRFNSEFIVLNTGGWKTATTKTRMNQASNQFGLGYYVKQVGGNWYCDFNGFWNDFFGDKLTLKR